MKENITTDSRDIKHLREYSCKFENLDKTDNFLKRFKLQKLKKKWITLIALYVVIKLISKLKIFPQRKLGQIALLEI